MSGLGADQEREIDRLSFAMLRDAYCDLASVLKLARPRAEQTVLRGLEAHVVAALAQLNADRAGDGSIDPVTLAVAERLRAVLDEARTPLPVDLPELSETVSTGWNVEAAWHGAHKVRRQARAGAAAPGNGRSLDPVSTAA